MFDMTRYSVAALLFVTSLVSAAPYSKYGRSCKDIGCLTNEVCVMAEDPCTYTREHCGRYPTCRKSSDAGGLSCSTMVCPSGQYCKTENGSPTCVNTVPNLGYDSAGVSVVNGHAVDHDGHQGSQSSSTNSNSNSNLNPYANANAPPPAPNQGDNYPVNSGTNLGYPAYPSSNSGGSSGSNIGFNTNAGNGYPPYPSNGNTGGNQGAPGAGTNLGYPPYPTQNRMPVPGQTNYPSQSGYPGQPGYPQQNGYPGYPQQPPQYPNGQRYPTGQYPGYQNYPGYQTPYQNRGYNSNLNTGHHRKNSGVTISPTVSLVILSFALIAKYFS